MVQKAISLICENPLCSKSFTKPLAEFKRSEKLGRQHFCSLRCYGQCKGVKQLEGKRTTAHLKKGSDRDELSPFRYYLKFINKSVKQRKISAAIALEDLQHLWHQQQGICPYTGWPLILLPCTTDWESTPLTPNRASLDRIDSSGGYTPDNLQFVAVIANFAKNSFTEAELFEFCDAVNHYRTATDRTHRVIEELDKNIIISRNPLINSRSPCNQRDEYSPFRQHLKLAKRHAREKERACTLTLEDLKQLWEKQGGKCVYTGWQLDNPQTTQGWIASDRHPKRASLDRIDSTFGYLPGNVQFVAVIANYAKRDFLESQLWEFCQAVGQYRRGQN